MHGFPEVCGQRVCLYELNKEGQAYTPASLRGLVRQVKSEFDSILDEKFSSGEFAVIDYLMLMYTSHRLAEGQQGLFMYQSQGVVLREGRKEDVLKGIKEGYVKSFAHALRDFRKCGPHFPSLDVFMNLSGYRDFILPEYQR